MYRSEIRPSQIDRLKEKAGKNNYQKYLSKLIISRCRAFEDATITFDFPVTALIGPNGGGKTTILGASALLYDSIAPRQFFTRNRQLDQDMKDWAISYEAIDREMNRMDAVKRTAHFNREKWTRDAISRNVIVFGVSRTLPAVERSSLPRFANKNVVFKPEEMTVYLESLIALYYESYLEQDLEKHLRVNKLIEEAVELYEAEGYNKTSKNEVIFKLNKANELLGITLEEKDKLKVELSKVIVENGLDNKINSVTFSNSILELLLESYEKESSGTLASTIKEVAYRMESHNLGSKLLLENKHEVYNSIYTEEYEILKEEYSTLERLVKKCNSLK